MTTPVPPPPARRHPLAALTTEPWRTPLSVAVGVRVALYILIFVFAGLLPGEPETKPGFLDALSAWDAQWYLRIATEGYWWRGPEVQAPIAFFPLYPFLSRAVGLLLGDLRWGFFVVTNVSFGAFLVYLYRLARRDFDAGTAERAVVYAAVFPAAFVLATFYTEALALALTTATLCYAREGRWRLAILLGFLAGLTRLPAALIVLPLAYEFWQQRGLRPGILALALVPLGTLAFAAYVGWLSGNPWTLLTFQQTAWFRQFVPPWEMFRMAFERVTWPRTHYVVAIASLDFGSMVLFTLLTLSMLWRMPRSYALYAFPTLFLVVSSIISPDKAPPTASVSRYLMAIFPAFIALARLTANPFLDQMVRWSFALLMGVFAIYFVTLHWVL